VVEDLWFQKIEFSNAHDPSGSVLWLRIYGFKIEFSNAHA
jgi:hypothetical protein